MKKFFISSSLVIVILLIAGFIYLFLKIDTYKIAIKNNSEKYSINFSDLSVSADTNLNIVMSFKNFVWNSIFLDAINEQVTLKYNIFTGRIKINFNPVTKIKLYSSSNKKKFTELLMDIQLQSTNIKLNSIETAVMTLNSKINKFIIYDRNKSQYTLIAKNATINYSTKANGLTSVNNSLELEFNDLRIKNFNMRSFQDIITNMQINFAVDDFSLNDIIKIMNKEYNKKYKIEVRRINFYSGNAKLHSSGILTLKNNLDKANYSGITTVANPYSLLESLQTTGWLGRGDFFLSKIIINPFIETKNNIDYIRNVPITLDRRQIYLGPVSIIRF